MFAFVILTLTSCFSMTTYSFIKRLMTIENNIPLVNTAHAQTSYPKDPWFKKKIIMKRKPMKVNGNPRDPKTTQPCGIGF